MLRGVGGSETLYKTPLQCELMERQVLMDKAKEVKLALDSNE